MQTEGFEEVYKLGFMTFSSFCFPQESLSPTAGLSRKIMFSGIVRTSHSLPFSNFFYFWKACRAINSVATKFKF